MKIIYLLTAALIIIPVFALSHDEDCNKPRECCCMVGSDFIDRNASWYKLRHQLTFHKAAWVYILEEKKNANVNFEPGDDCFIEEDSVYYALGNGKFHLVNNFDKDPGGTKCPHDIDFVFGKPWRGG